MKRDGVGPPTIAVVAALICVLIAIGAGLQGQFSFGPPRWIPGAVNQPAPTLTPEPQASAAPTGAPRHIASNPQIVFGILPILIVSALLLMTLIALLVRYWLRHRRLAVGRFLTVDAAFEDSLAEIHTEADLPTLHRGLLRAADVLESNREPGDAIVRAWLGLQEAAEDSGVRRRPAETPTEFTSRVFESVDADRAAAATLLEVYLRVRFRSGAVTDADVAVARDSIQRLRDSWPVQTPA